MTLGELIERLEALPEDMLLAEGFGIPDSYRGTYSELAFAPCANVRVYEMLKHAKSAVGATFTGYKGGEYLMTLDTPCHIAEYGCYGGDEDALTIHRWKYMLTTEVKEEE